MPTYNFYANSWTLNWIIHSFIDEHEGWFLFVLYQLSTLEESVRDSDSKSGFPSGNGTGYKYSLIYFSNPMLISHVV